MAAPTRTHRTQQERSDATRELLLDATIECLVELGYGRTTTNEICRRAGVSRGAQQHHFANKAELMAKAIEHLVTKLRAQFDNVTVDGVDAAVDQLWHNFSGTLSTAALELWVASRTDPELREAMGPVDRALGRSVLEGYRETIESVVETPDVEAVFWLTVNLTRGLALDAMIGGDPRRRKKLLAEWKRVVRAVYLR